MVTESILGAVVEADMSEETKDDILKIGEHRFTSASIGDCCLP